MSVFVIGDPFCKSHGGAKRRAVRRRLPVALLFSFVLALVLLHIFVPSRPTRNDAAVRGRVARWKGFIQALVDPFVRRRAPARGNLGFFGHLHHLPVAD
jgi:hypothetical protein